jgi:hypothetical protein
MAKALYGHVGQDLDLRMANELRRMRDRVRSLELEVARLQAANKELTDGLRIDGDMLTLVPEHRVAEREPALT